MFPSKKAIELSVNFLVMLIIAIVLFGMGIYLATTILDLGHDISERHFDEFDRQVGELSCYAADNVCINVKSEEIRRAKTGVFAVTVRNALEEKDFKVTVMNTKLVTSDGAVIESFDDLTPKMLLFGMDTAGRINTLEKSEKKTFGVGVEVPKNAKSGQYTLTVDVDYAESGTGAETGAVWTHYTDKPYVMFVNVP